MATIEGLNANLKSEVADGDAIQGVSKENAAKQASDLFTKGDIKGAYGVLIKADPTNAGALLHDIAQYDPELAKGIAKAHKVGELEGQTPFGSNPAQIQQLQNEGALAVARAKTTGKEKPVIRKDPDSPSGFSTFQGNNKYFINQMGEVIGQGPDASAAPATQEQPKQPKLAPNQDIGADGKPVTLAPTQSKAIDQIKKTFASDTKDLVKGIEAAQQGSDLTQLNIPGFEALERLRILRGVMGGSRIAQQEFQATGQDMGAINDLENKLSKLGGQGMSPEVQKLYLRVSQATLRGLSKEYDQKLKNTLETAPGSVDQFVLKKRLMGSGPTVYQNVVQKVQQLPGQDQAAVNWAHDNPTDPRAKAILKANGF
jgi:hypothetical protein